MPSCIEIDEELLEESMVPLWNYPFMNRVVEIAGARGGSMQAIGKDN